jgi:hypothetical protein
VKTRCWTPSCYHQYAGGYFYHCPDGDHPLPKSEQTVPTEADRNSAPDPSLQPRAHSQLDPTAIQAVTGDWELRLGASPKPLAVLHLRPGATGYLEGSLEQSLGAPGQRVMLRDVDVSGSTITYTTPGGTSFRGTLSGDGQSIVGEPGSPTWQRVSNR